MSFIDARMVYDSDGKNISNKIGLLNDSINQFTNLLSSNGYQKLPSGIIMQWGSVDLSSLNAGSSTYITTTFPIAFPSNCLFMLVDVAGRDSSDNTALVQHRDVFPTTSNASVRIDNEGANSIVSGSLKFFVIGN